MDSFDRVVGEASLVALGESDHFIAEPLELRNALFRHLVLTKGFTAIALESGLVEGRRLHDYVLCGPDDAGEVLADGLSWTFDRLPQNAQLIRWMRAYNADARPERQIRFYGFDVPGSPGTASAKRGPETALFEALEYLNRVECKTAARFHTRLDAVLPKLRFGMTFTAHEPGYHQLAMQERDPVTAAIADLIALFERSESRFVAASSRSEYDWAYRAALGARQVDGWLRHIPLHWRADGEQCRFIGPASDARDRAQADNLDWIIRREGPDGRILIFAHNNHLSTAPISATTRAISSSSQTWTYHREPAGTYLRRRFGKNLVAIATLTDTAGAHACAPPGLLDLRTAPSDIAQPFRERRRFGPISGIPGLYETANEVSMSEAFDAIYVFDTATPAYTAAGGSA